MGIETGVLVALYRIRSDGSFLFAGFFFAVALSGFFRHIGMLIVVQLHLLLPVVRALVGGIIQVRGAAASGSNSIYRYFIAGT